MGILVCIVILGLSIHHNGKVSQERAKYLDEVRKEQAAEEALEKESPSAAPKQSGAATPVAEAGEAEAAPSGVQAREFTLANEYFRLTFTNQGAGIKTAELLKHRRDLDNGGYVTINETRDSPVGALSGKPNEVDNSLWTVTEESSEGITFSADLPDGLHIDKIYRLPEGGAKPYEIELELSIRNDSDGPVELENTGARYLYAGGQAPLHFNEWSMQIGLFLKENRSTFRTETVDFFGGGRKVLGVFGRNEKPYAILPSESKVADNLAWAGVNNQFYATLIHAREPVDGRVWADKYPVIIDGDRTESEKKRMRGCELAMSLPALALKPGDQTTLTYDIYMGPKSAPILKTGGGEREEILNYSQIPIFGWVLGWAISPLAGGLDWGMRKIESFVGSYGWAIIILTFIIRLLVWPVYAKSTRSMKRMSKLTPLMKEIKEKYPDDPQRVNQETMKLYREYNINPMGGCLPMFIQLPVFLAFYRMLWGAVELRHESFLGFVADLTQPDQLAMIPGLGIPLNILPILMGLTSFIQMAMTPKTGDNTQRMIFMMMPLIFLVICYNFASGLALYWTTSNVFSIFQTWIMNKIPEPELKKAPGQTKGKKGFFEKLQERMEEAQAMQQQQQKGGGGTGSSKSPGGGSKGGAKKSAKKKGPAMPQPGQSRTKLASEKGSRHTKSKKKRR